MPVDAQFLPILQQVEAAGPPDFSRLTPELMREIYRRLTIRSEPAISMAMVRNLELPGPEGKIAARFYLPHGEAEYPLLVYFHGGGFVICDLDTHDSTCRALANAGRCAVLSVDYRLAPEAKFPVPLEDCYAATKWAAESKELKDLACVDLNRLVVGGDSAGGNLAAATCMLAMERGGPRIVHQLLIYPVIDYSFDTGSYQEFAEGYFLRRDMMEWYWGHYLASPEDGNHPLASPLRAKNLADLPPATVITAEYDPLRDEGEAYAQRLAAAGVATSLRRYDGMIHGFFSMFEFIERAQEAIDYAGKQLETALERSAAEAVR